MQIENLFPTPVSFFNFDEGLTPAQKDFIDAQAKRPNEGNASSVDTYILRNAILNNLTTFIEQSLHHYFMATITPKSDVRLRITQSWLNWTAPGQYHHKHSHPNSIISGCFYVNADKQSDRIYFYREDNRQIRFSAAEWNMYNSESWWLPVGSGELILFPSSLTHKVMPVGGAHTRLSLAFNTFPVGDLGDETGLTALHLER